MQIKSDTLAYYRLSYKVQTGFEMMEIIRQNRLDIFQACLENNITMYNLEYKNYTLETTSDLKRRTFLKDREYTAMWDIFYPFIRNFDLK